MHFLCFSIFSKKEFKIDLKIGSRQMIETIAHLGPEMHPKFIKIELENPENPRNRQKMLFFDGVHFWLILRVAQKHEKRVMIQIRGFPVVCVCGGGGPQDGNL